MQELKVVVFKIGQEAYGLEIGVVQGIENVMDIVNTPNSPDYIKGIINLRGEVIPIYNLRAKFGLSDIEFADSTKFIIVKTAECNFALQVDEVENIRNIEEDKVFEAPLIIKNNKTEYVDKIINVEGMLVVLINPINLLPREDRYKLSMIVNQAKDA